MFCVFNLMKIGVWQSFPVWENIIHKVFDNLYCQAQFKSSSSSVQLRTETGLIITVKPTPPTHPGQVYWKYPGS